MENQIRLPSVLCDKIFKNQYEIQTGNLTEQLLSSTLELYSEAIFFYSNLLAQKAAQEGFDSSVYIKRSRFYQEKIKRLMVRQEVQQCLIDKKSSHWGYQLQKEISLIETKAPEQVRTLLDHCGVNFQHQVQLIARTLNSQRDDLNARIERRSKSKQRKSLPLGEINLTEPKKQKRSLVFLQF